MITLGTLYIYRGINFAWAGGNQINASDLPRRSADLGTATVLGSRCSRSSRCPRRRRRVRAALPTGPAASSTPSARIRPPRELYGIRVGRRVFAAFVVSGALAGLAGVLYAARYGTVGATAGIGMELNVGRRRGRRRRRDLRRQRHRLGRRHRRRAADHDQPALPILGMNQFWQRAVVGALILLAIVLDRVLAARRWPTELKGRSEHRDRRLTGARTGATRRADGACGHVLVAVVAWSSVVGAGQRRRRRPARGSGASCSSTSSRSC